MTTLQIIWFFLIGVLLIGYALLDGFDLGVGFWYLFTKKNEHRRLMLNSIGPVWDGNEVWLLTGGGAIFAAFPPVYASVFSGFYLALLLLLLALMFRAVSFEFRSQVDSDGWRSFWDWSFALGSILAALLLPVALGNVMRGIPLDEHGNYTGTFFGLLNPYALVIGLTGVAMLATHGALYLQLKVDGELREMAESWAGKSWVAYLVLWLVGAGYTWAAQSHLTENYLNQPAYFLAPLIALVGIVGIKVFATKGERGKAFIASCVSIFGNLATVGFALFPRLVPALGDPSRSLTAANSSSSEYTLTAMLILALIGVPIVLAYTIWVYRLFRGKVELDDHSY